MADVCQHKIFNQWWPSGDVEVATWWCQLIPVWVAIQINPHYSLCSVQGAFLFSNAAESALFMTLLAVCNCTLIVLLPIMSALVSKVMFLSW